jgi:hypothetical protein
MATATTPIAEAGIFSPGVEHTTPKSRELPRQDIERSHSDLKPANVLYASPLQSAPDARPNRLLFGALKDPGLRLRRPIPLDLTVEQGSVVLSWGEAEEFGSGQTMSDAVDDFGRALCELYHRLYERDVRLSIDLQKVKEVLAYYIQPR